MCGISGIVTRGPTSPEQRALVSRVSAAQAHRGPDGAGEYADAHVHLAARRLSIIDLEGGWQPLHDEDESVALVANGEIYNFVELRRRLESRGHRFRTGSDCEVIVHLYEEFGLGFVGHLRGMFALALWDKRRRRLVLARDRMGEKPLYLCERDGQLVFASELKALVRAGAVPFELDAEAVNLFFHYQYVPEPKTALKGVRKLDAAHLLVVEADPWRVAEECYWRMGDAPPLAGAPAGLIRERLEEVGGLVVRSDVPVGVALSGGLDSSAVAALAARARPGAISAFSVGYEGRPEPDERADAADLARVLGLPFREVELTTREIVAFFPDLNYWRDDPVADISGHGYYAVMRLAREHGVPVMLQGQGGDELFWGYPQLRQAALESLQKNSARGMTGPRALAHYVSPAAPPALSRSELSAWARDLGGARSGWRRFRSHRASPPGRMIFYDAAADFRSAAQGIFTHYGRPFVEELGGRDAAELFTFEGPWPDIEATLTSLVCATYLRENGITQGDRLGMASSVEMRLPLVDHKLVETVVGLRKTNSDVRLPPKAWLKAAVKDLLPARVLDRPKRGFAPPTTAWHDALFAAYGDSLRDGHLARAGVLSREGADELARGDFPAGATCPLSFKALVLEQWCRAMAGGGEFSTR
ncbi:MAG: asparagine synthase (glutamine-hydrolyzing) [Acidobacteria bacterium]|nr:asparagine synthase (glutamine-hydrolyzing) [Acidobacteriota bacterium]